MDDRARRIGQNEAFFRDVNERVRSVNDEFGALPERMDFVCECGDASCTARVALSAAEYESVRADSALFAVRPGHVAPDVETVVEEHETFAVVRKLRGGPERLAAETDPRS